MDRNVINRKLDSLARCVRRIETKRPRTPDQLVSDIDLQDKTLTTSKNPT
jgi:hypothetical protein